MEPIKFNTIENNKKVTKISENRFHTLDLEAKSREVFSNLILKDGRFKFDLIGGTSHYDAIIALEEDKYVGVQFKCTTEDTVDEKGRYQYGKINEYDGMIVICMVLSEDYSNCTKVYFNFGGLMINLPRYPKLTVTKSTSECLDWMETELNILSIDNYHGELDIVTKDEAECALCPDHLTEKINRETFIKLCPFLKVTEHKLVYTPIDFFIDYKDLRVSVQLKALYRPKTTLGYATSLDKKYLRTRNSYNLRDGVDLFLLSHSNEKRHHSAFLLTIWELYTNGYIDLIQYDKNYCLKTLPLYPPGTPIHEKYQSSRDRPVWANVGYFEYDNPNLETFIESRILQAMAERQYIIEKLHNESHIPPIPKNYISWDKAVQNILPEFIRKLDRKVFIINDLYKMCWPILVKLTGRDPKIYRRTLERALRKVKNSDVGSLKRIEKTKRSKYFEDHEEFKHAIIYRYLR